MALHIRIRAAGSIWVICFTASIPPISGMMMSIVTRSGLSCWYFSTACLPFSASPTTVNPAWDKMSLTIVRMNTASSQTSTVLLTLPPLSDDLQNHCLDVEHEDALTLDFNCSGYRTRQRDFRVIRGPELIYRHILNVTNVVDSDSYPPVEIIDQQNQSLRARTGLLAQRRAPVDDGDYCPAQIDDSAHGVGCSRQPRYVLHRHDLAKRIHVARERAAANVEHEQAPRRNLRLFLDDLVGRERDGVTHKIPAP